ncbi:MAG: hypothetical protein K2H43_00785 [Clostridia bacterium]|nr:hypothetical protein [Clostridia bacterium]
MKKFLKISALLLTTCTLAVGAAACGSTSARNNERSGESQTEFVEENRTCPDCPEIPENPDCPDCPKPEKRAERLPHFRRSGPRRKAPAPREPRDEKPCPDEDDGQATEFPREEEPEQPSRPMPLPAN